jgi:hypothetical protein
MTINSRSDIVRWIAVCSIPFILAGCKVEITVPGQGSVESVSGAYTCTASSPCIIDVVDYYFDETFVPMAEPGQAFTGWAATGEALCAGGLGDCRLVTTGMENNALVASRVEQNSVYSLTPEFADHNREAFHGDWFGKVMQENGETIGNGTEETQVQTDGSSITISRNLWSERVTCDYNGQFDVSATAGRKAREAISGTFQCNTSPTTLGTFTGFIYATSDHHTVVELDSTPEEGATVSTMSILHRDYESRDINPYRAASVAGAEIEAQHFGDYSGSQIQAGPKCGALVKPDSFVDFELKGIVGNQTIKTSVSGGADCEYTQNTPFELAGTYQCDDERQGLWESEGFKVHKTLGGPLLAIDITRYGHTCSVVHLSGW